MKQRSTWQMYLPIVLALALSAWSFAGASIVFVWYTIGFIAFKALGRKVTTMGRGESWKRGVKRVALVNYHLFWWPWFVFQRSAKD